MKKLLERLQPRNIWFLCPSCTRKLVVERAAAGFRADCPHCHRNIPIPMHSTTTPTWFRQVALYASHALLLAGGLGVGLWFAADRGEPAASPRAVSAAPVSAAAPTATVATAPAPAPSPSEEVNRQLLDEHVALKQKYDKMLQWMIDNVRGTYPLPERLVQRLRITPLDESLQVNPELAEVLRMTDQEKAMVQDIFTYIRSQLTEAELDQALITEQGEDRITLKIPPYAEVGEALREDLFLTLEDTLGGARFDRLVDVTGEELDQSFHHFGKAERTLTFEVIYPREGESFAPYVLIRDGWIIPEGDSVRLTKVTETAVTAIPDSYKAYGPHLPGNVARYATP